MRLTATIWYNRTLAECRLQPLPALCRNPMAIYVYCDRNATVAELFLHISGAHVRHQHQGRIRVPQVVRVSDAQVC
jgi:hypothetical protein